MSHTDRSDSDVAKATVKLSKSDIIQIALERFKPLVNRGVETPIEILAQKFGKSKTAEIFS